MIVGEIWLVIYFRCATSAQLGKFCVFYCECVRVNKDRSNTVNQCVRVRAAVCFSFYFFLLPHSLSHRYELREDDDASNMKRQRFVCKCSVCVYARPDRALFVVFHFVN